MMLGGASTWDLEAGRSVCAATARSVRWRFCQSKAPEAVGKHVPRYPLVSRTLIGPLAVAKEPQAQHLAPILLADAPRRAFESTNTVGCSMVRVNALNEGAA